MPLHDQVVALLERRSAMGAVPIETLSIADARAVFARSVLSDGADMHSVEDLIISTQGREILLRLYRPAPQVHGPVMLFVHGGGWMLGDLATYDPLCRQIATTARCIVVAVEYRLAPEHPFPAGLEDVYTAASWIENHRAALGLDGAMVVAGDSAGANLAGAVALAARDRGGPDLAAQVLVYPLTDAAADTASLRLYATGYMVQTSALTWFWSHYLARPDDAENPYASPLRAPNLTGLPPALIITAEFDPVRDEGEAYGAALTAAGNEVVVSRYAGMIHGFVQMPAVIDHGADAIAQIGDFVAAAARRSQRV